MKSRDIWIGFAFVCMTLVAFLASLGLSGPALRLWDSFSVSVWVAKLFAGVLLLSAIGVLFRWRLARFCSLLLVGPLIPLFGYPIIGSRHTDIMGGNGPDANPMAGVIWLLLAGSATISILLMGFFIWLLEIGRAHV